MVNTTSAIQQQAAAVLRRHVQALPNPSVDSWVHFGQWDGRFCGVKGTHQITVDAGNVTCPHCKPRKVIALLSAQGSACTETALYGDQDTPANRAAVEAQFCGRVYGNERGSESSDRVMPDTWTDVSDNDAFA